jgi:hypothetical protein
MASVSHAVPADFVKTLARSAGFAEVAGIESAFIGVYPST